eukprot:1777146-Prymnesium_polylepis.1
MTSKMKSTVSKKKPAARAQWCVAAWPSESRGRRARGEPRRRRANLRAGLARQRRRAAGLWAGLARQRLVPNGQSELSMLPVHSSGSRPCAGE